MNENLVLITLLILSAIVYYFVIQNNKIKKEIAEEAYIATLKKAKQIIVTHKKQLSIQRKKSVHIDDYGRENLKSWFKKEIPYFIETQIYPRFNFNEQHYIQMSYNEIASFIEQESKNYIQKEFGYNATMNGFEFELFCSEKLKSEGWVVKKTKNGGDQGVDLIIEKKNRKIGVQCKKYSKPIGNKSVQEIKAGILFYNLTEGIVLGNNTFTKSAIELGNSNKIKLLHYLETDKI